MGMGQFSCVSQIKANQKIISWLSSLNYAYIFFLLCSHTFSSAYQYMSGGEGGVFIFKVTYYSKCCSNYLDFLI